MIEQLGNEKITAIYSNAPLSGGELKSIRSMVAYVAYQKGLNNETVSTLVEHEFNVMSVGDLRRCDYEVAMRYLVDMSEPEAAFAVIN